jgi:membrane-bound lytic murein transglycosylase D
MKKSPAILTVALTLFFSFFCFAYWLPAKVNQQSAYFYDEPRPALISVAAAKAAKSLSKDLIAYVEEARVAAGNSLSDLMSDEEILRKVREFEADANPTHAEDLLENRFRGPAAGEDGLFAGRAEFPVPDKLRDTVEFWKRIFGVYGKDDVIFYNQDDVGIVYSVLDFSDLKAGDAGTARGIQDQMTRQELARVQETLAKVSPLAGDPAAAAAAHLNDYERRILALLEKNSDHVDVSLSALKSSLVYRNGWSHRVRQAIVASGRYMPEMRRIFAEQGLPVELTTIPFIESAFNLDAYSSAGAAGIWQFIPATGKNYLRIDGYVDERYDPILATYAAAAHLGKEYRLMRDWPLTINGYNTGPGRILKAVKELRTRDIAEIVRLFHGSGYGFDSRNYYPEFLAALEVYENRHAYFGDIPEAAAEDYDYVRLTEDTNVKLLFRTAGADEAVMRSYNKALNAAVLNGVKKLPKGYLVKVPALQRENVIMALNELHRDDVVATYHVVGKGENLREIAADYGIAVEDLRDMNGLSPGDRIRRGDLLKLPKGVGGDEDLTGYSMSRPGEEGEFDTDPMPHNAGEDFDAEPLPENEYPNGLPPDFPEH